MPHGKDIINLEKNVTVKKKMSFSFYCNRSAKYILTGVDVFIQS